MTALERNPGEWDQADKSAKEAILTVIDLVKEKENGWFLFLQASSEALYAEIGQSRFYLQRTIRNYEYCLETCLI